MDNKLVYLKRVCGRLTSLAVVSLMTAATAVAQSAPSARIVTLGGSVTEIVFALGLGNQIVGVDGSSHYPAQADQLPKVGPVYRAIPAEGVLALRPTVVIGTTDVGPATAVEQIKSAGVKVALVPVAEGVDGLMAKIHGVAAVLNAPQKGDTLAASVKAQISAAQAFAAKAKSRPRVLFVYARGGGNLFVSGTTGPADAMITLANAQNAITQFQGFKPLTAEAVIAAAPEVIVIPQHGLESIGGLKGLLALPGIALTPAGKAKRVAVVDDELLLGFGPRLAQGIRDLAEGIHPELRTVQPSGSR